MEIVTLILVYIGLLFLSGVITWIADDIMKGNGELPIVVSNWVGWSLALMMIYNISYRPNADYLLELERDGTITISDNIGEITNVELEDLETFIEIDNY